MVVSQPERILFVWASERCTRRLNPETFESYPVKDFKKLKRAGYDLSRVLAIDDSPEKHERNFGNLIRVHPFLGDTSDAELRDLISYLEWLRHLTDYRSIEKRNWRYVATRLKSVSGDPGRDATTNCLD